MASTSCLEPKSLQLLVCDVKYPNGNYLIHEFVFRNCDEPRDSRSESYIRYVLRSFPSASVSASTYEEGFTVLHLAVMKRDSYMVKMLLSCLPTVDVDARCGDGKGDTALHLAAAGDGGAFANAENNYATLDVKEDSLEIVKVLIEYGAAVDALGLNDNTPLHESAWHNRIDTLKFLIKEGANLHARNDTGSTPLHEAARNGCLEAVEVLLESGAVVDAENLFGDTTLYYACDRIDILKLLISKGADVNVRNNTGDTPLHIAARIGYFEVVKFLVEIGAAVDAVNDLGNTVLHDAALFNRPDVCELLISKGLDVNLKGLLGITPISMAVAIDVVKVLAESGASVNVRVRNGVTRTPLYAAATHDRSELLKLLISKGADLNAKDDFGNTPLHSAARYGYMESVKVLIESGAVLDAENEDGNTALRIAEEQNEIEIAEYLNYRYAAKFGQPPIKKNA